MTQSFEYKSVVLSQTISRRRKRKEKAVDLIRTELDKILNENAADGWEFVSSEVLKTYDRKGFLGPPMEVPFTALVFKRYITHEQQENAEHSDPPISSSEDVSRADQKSLSALD